MRLLAALVLGSLGLWPSLAVAQSVKIGAVVPLTGRYGAGGAQVRAGYEIAVEHINAAGGISIGGKKVPLELVLLDDESDATKTVARLEAPGAQGVVAYLGGFGSDLHAAAASVAEKNKTPYLGVAFALYKVHQQGFRYLDPRRAERRYGCGFHREKGSHVCANALTVKIATVERRLLEAIRTKLLNPEAVRYLITAVNQHLDVFRVTEGEARHRLEHELHQVEEELRNVERAILAGVVSETTAALVQDREAQRRSLKQRLVGLEARGRTGPLRADAGTITAQLARLDDLLRRDIPRANGFFRTHVTPITCTPVKQNGRKFYRATVAANGPEIIKSLGLAQAFDFGGCGGWI